MQDPDLQRQFAAALRGERRIDPHFRPAVLRREPDGAVTIEGEVDTVARKRLVLERLGAIPGVDDIVDRLRVRPAEAMSDAGIRDRLRNKMLQEPSFQGVRLTERVGQQLHVLADVPAGPAGTLEIEVKDGVVTLNGALPSLASKRLAGLFPWYVPGTRDVVNGIAVEPPEEDAPIRIEEAVRIALELDPFVDAAQVRVGVRGRVVRLTGALSSPGARQAAESDAWYVFGVDDVINELE